MRYADCKKDLGTMLYRYSKWAEKEHAIGKRIAATLFAGVILLILFPLVVAGAGPFLDRLLGLPSYRFGAVNDVIGGLLVVVGLFFALWSIFIQLTRGRGTPLPMMPTHELLTKGPFRYCRNPMTFGTILACLGIGLVAGTIAGIAIVLCFALLLVLYLKGIEEKELSERFGCAYLAYRREVPFIIPKPPKRR